MYAEKKITQDVIRDIQQLIPSVLTPRPDYTLTLDIVIYTRYLRLELKATLTLSSLIPFVNGFNFLISSPSILALQSIAFSVFFKFFRVSHVIADFSFP